MKIKAGVPYELAPDDNPSYERWMERVDALCYRMAGCSVYDLPDCLYRDWYEVRLRPVRAAARAIRNAGE